MQVSEKPCNSRSEISRDTHEILNSPSDFEDSGSKQTSSKFISHLKPYCNEVGQPARVQRGISIEMWFLPFWDIALSKYSQTYSTTNRPPHVRSLVLILLFPNTPEKLPMLLNEFNVSSMVVTKYWRTMSQVVGFIY